jgi:hypothetical protein
MRGQTDCADTINQILGPNYLVIGAHAKSSIWLRNGAKESQKRAKSGPPMSAPTKKKSRPRGLTDERVAALKPVNGRSLVVNDSQRGLYLVSGGQRKVTKTWRVRHQELVSHHHSGSAISRDGRRGGP